MLQENLLAQTPIKPGLVVPKYFKLFFDLLDHGNKGYVCEHDLFEFMQELDGLAKQKKGQPAHPGKEDDTEKIDSSLFDLAMAGKKKTEEPSLFTETFSEDSILITNALKKPNVSELNGFLKGKSRRNIDRERDSDAFDDVFTPPSRK